MILRCQIWITLHAIRKHRLLVDLECQITDKEGEKKSAYIVNVCYILMQTEDHFLQLHGLCVE